MFSFERNIADTNRTVSVYTRNDTTLPSLQMGEPLIIADNRILVKYSILRALITILTRETSHIN